MRQTGKIRKIGILITIICMFVMLFQTVVGAAESRDSFLTTAQGQDAELPDDWVNHPQISIDNVIYEIPCKFSDFLDDGWKIREKDVEFIDLDAILKPGEYYKGYPLLYKPKFKEADIDDFYFLLQLRAIRNDSQTDQKLRDCNVHVVSADRCFTTPLVNANYPKTSVAKGIVFGSQENYLRQAYGDPKEESSSLSGNPKYLVYTQEDASGNTVQYWFTIHEDDGVTKIEVTVAPPREIDTKEEASTETKK